MNKFHYSSYNTLKWGYVTKQKKTQKNDISLFLFNYSFTWLEKKTLVERFKS